jgi:hypothetical protein
MDVHGWSVRQLGAELAVHHAQVVRALALIGLPEAVQELVEQGGSRRPPPTRCRSSTARGSGDRGRGRRGREAYP